MIEEFLVAVEEYREDIEEALGDIASLGVPFFDLLESFFFGGFFLFLIIERPAIESDFQLRPIDSG